MFKLDGLYKSDIFHLIKNWSAARRHMGRSPLHRRFNPLFRTALHFTCHQKCPPITSAHSFIFLVLSSLCKLLSYQNRISCLIQSQFAPSCCESTSRTFMKSRSCIFQTLSLFDVAIFATVSLSFFFLSPINPLRI